MAARQSFYRREGTTRRGNKAQLHDHDVFEGLPIRRWSKQWIWIGKKPAPPAPTIDLPLPKDTHLLTPLAQTLLQAARNGTFSGNTPKQDEPSKPTEEAEPHRLFMTNKWTVTPRDNEPPEPEYLSRITTNLVKRGGVIVEEEEEEEVQPALNQAQYPAGTSGFRKRPPPPRRKPGKGRKPGFKKMVTFAEDGRALPANVEVEGLVAPPVQMIIEEDLMGSATPEIAARDGDVEMGEAAGIPDILTAMAVEVVEAETIDVPKLEALLEETVVTEESVARAMSADPMVDAPQAEPSPPAHVAPIDQILDAPPAHVTPPAASPFPPPAAAPSPPKEVHAAPISSILENPTPVPAVEPTPSSPHPVATEGEAEHVEAQ